MLVAAVIATGLIIRRDRGAGLAWHTVTAGLLFALMVGWSGHNNVLIGIQVLVIVTFAQAITGHPRPPTATSRRPGPPPRPGKLKVSQRQRTLARTFGCSAGVRWLA